MPGAMPALHLLDVSYCHRLDLTSLTPFTQLETLALQVVACGAVSLGRAPGLCGTMWVARWFVRAGLGAGMWRCWPRVSWPCPLAKPWPNCHGPLKSESPPKPPPPLCCPMQGLGLIEAGYMPDALTTSIAQGAVAPRIRVLPDLEPLAANLQVCSPGGVSAVLLVSSGEQAGWAMRRMDCSQTK